MTNIYLRKTLGATALLCAALLSTSVLADRSPDTYGPGYGMGSMMGGSGMGGMMDGYGSGHGMGGYGHGERMGGQRSDCGMGPGMMGGSGLRSDLNLSADQRSKIAKIQNDLRRQHWALMGKMLDEQAQMGEQYSSDNPDDAMLKKTYRNMSDLRHQMFDLSLDARKQIEAVLTKEQREKQKRG